MNWEQAMTAPWAKDFFWDLNEVYAKHLGNNVSADVNVAQQQVQQVQQVPQTQQVIPEPQNQVPTPDVPTSNPTIPSDPVSNPDDLDKKLKQDIDSDRERMKQVDDLLNWINQDKVDKDPVTESDDQVFESEKDLEKEIENTNNPNWEEEETWSWLTDDEIITLIETAEKLEDSIITLKAENRHLKTEKALLEERSKSYLEKYQNVIMDESRVSIPDDLALLVRYYQASQSWDENMSNIQKERYLRELISLAEKGYWRDLSAYVSDSHAYWQEDIDKWSISQYNIASKRKWQSDDQNLSSFIDAF